MEKKTGKLKKFVVGFFAVLGVLFVLIMLMPEDEEDVQDDYAVTEDIKVTADSDGDGKDNGNPANDDTDDGGTDDGDTVNTAARLEANAPGGTLYISRSVADKLEGRIRYTSLGDTIKLKGKAEGFEVLKVDELL